MVACAVAGGCWWSDLDFCKGAKVMRYIYLVKVSLARSPEGLMSAVDIEVNRVPHDVYLAESLEWRLSGWRCMSFMGPFLYHLAVKVGEVNE